MSLPSVKDSITPVPFGKEQDGQEVSHPSPVLGLLHLDALKTLAKLYKCSPALMTLRIGFYAWKITGQL